MIYTHIFLSSHCIYEDVVDMQGDGKTGLTWFSLSYIRWSFRLMQSSIWINLMTLYGIIVQGFIDHYDCQCTVIQNVNCSSTKFLYIWVIYELRSAIDFLYNLLISHVKVANISAKYNHKRKNQINDTFTKLW